MDLRSRVTPINILSLCSGIGGIELGLKLAIPHARVVCMVEREAYCIAVLEARMSDGSLDDCPIWTDIESFDGKPWGGKVHIISSGFPCQPHSIAGKRRGAADPRDLWPQVRRVIGEVCPPIVFLENVPNIRRYYFERIRPELSGMGYSVAEGLFSAAEVGASHRRQRLFILGYSELFSQQLWGISRELDWEGGKGEAEGEERERVRDAGSYAGEDVDDSRGKPCGKRCGAVFEWRRKGDRKQARAAGRELAHTHTEGLEGWDKRGDSGSQGAVGEGSPKLERLPIFPPKPSDLKGWASVLSFLPSLEPAVCRLDDGLSSQLGECREQLAAYGNAVVPLQAAYSFIMLARKMGVVGSDAKVE